MITSLSLKIDFDATPITGTLEDEHGRQHAFAGWLGLSDVLHRIGAQQTPPSEIGHLEHGAEPHTRR